MPSNTEFRIADLQTEIDRIEAEIIGLEKLIEVEEQSFCPCAPHRVAAAEAELATLCARERDLRDDLEDLQTADFAAWRREVAIARGPLV